MPSSTQTNKTLQDTNLKISLLILVDRTEIQLYKSSNFVACTLPRNLFIPTPSWKSSKRDSKKSTSPNAINKIKQIIYHRGIWRQYNKHRLKICFVASSLFAAICASTYCLQNLAWVQTSISKNQPHSRRNDINSITKHSKNHKLPPITTTTTLNQNTYSSWKQ